MTVDDDLTEAGERYARQKIGNAARRLRRFRDMLARAGREHDAQKVGTAMDLLEQVADGGKADA